MITYEVLRKKAQLPVVVNDEGGTIFQRIARNHVSRRVPQQHPLAPPINLHNQPIFDDRKLHPIGMGKIEYARWLTAAVYSRFPKGALVTMAALPYVPGQAPNVWWKVHEIQELHYIVQYDKGVGQPKCVGIVNPRYNNTVSSPIPVYYPPALLRACQPEEIIAIDHLRNQTSEQRNKPDAGLDGTEQSVDRSTGETS